MPNAIVTGATGILGREILFELAGDASKWQKIYAFSRSQKEDYPPNVQHKYIDLQSNAQEMAKELQGVEAEYAFFAAYLAKGDEDEASNVNGAMLENFLSALRHAGAEKKLKRVVLVTGAKQYGLHLGRPKVPMEESDPWVEGDGWPPNFYYTQQRILYKAAESGGWDWVVTYPNDVIGAVTRNFMNLSVPLGLYAAVAKELGEDLIWPGSPTFYTAQTTFTAAKLHAGFCDWAASEPKCRNQAFNVINGDVVSWQSLWPKLAKRYGMRVAADQFTRPIANDLGNVMPLKETPPITIRAAELGLEGSPLLQQSKVESRIALAKWSQKKEVKHAWERLVERNGLNKEIWDQATWDFCDFVLGRNYDINISCNKAREFGWTGFQDTWAAFEKTFQDLESMKALPKPTK